MRDGLTAIRLGRAVDSSRRSRAAFRRERPRRERRARLRPGVPRRRSARPRVSARGHAADRFRFRAKDRSASAARGGSRDPPYRRALGALRHQERHAPAERARVPAGPRGGAMDAILVRDGFASEGTKANLFTVAPGVCGRRRRVPESFRGSRAPPLSRPRRSSVIRSRSGPSASRRCLRRTRSFSPPRRSGPTRSSRSKGGRSGAGEPGPVAARIREVLQAEFSG